MDTRPPEEIGRSGGRRPAARYVGWALMILASVTLGFLMAGGTNATQPVSVTLDPPISTEATVSWNLGVPDADWAAQVLLDHPDAAARLGIVAPDQELNPDTPVLPGGVSLDNRLDLLKIGPLTPETSRWATCTDIDVVYAFDYRVKYAVRVEAAAGWDASVDWLREASGLPINDPSLVYRTVSSTAVSRPPTGTIQFVLAGDESPLLENIELGNTVVWYSGNPSVIRAAQIVLPVRAITGYIQGDTPGQGATSMTIAAHELAHAVGVGHSRTTADLMAPTLHTGTRASDADLTVLAAMSSLGCPDGTAIGTAEAAITSELTEAAHIHPAGGHTHD
jgi:hypothetical protein